MSQKKFIRIVVVAAVAAAISVFFWLFGRKAPVSAPAEAPLLVQFAPEVETAIAEKISLLKSALETESPAAIAFLKQTGQKNEHLTLTDISALDAHWITAPETDPLIASVLANPTADVLKSFQSAHREFSEIFVTDTIGLNVGATNKTSDYYQADESWWTEAYQHGMGRTYHSAIEFDESAQTEGISIYIPIHDSDSGQIIGIAKAVINLSELKRGL